MRYALSIAGLAVLFALAGCSSLGEQTPSVHPVSGKVLIGSSPAYGAEISLVPKEKDGKTFGADASALLNKDGTFTLKSLGQEGAAPGFYTVVIDPRQVPASRASEKSFGVQSIPKKYWSAETSPLTVEITGEKTGWEVKIGN